MVEQEIQRFGSMTCTMGNFKPFDRQVKSILEELSSDIRIEKGAAQKLQEACEALAENFTKARHHVRSFLVFKFFAEALPEDLRRTLFDPKTKLLVLKGNRSDPSTLNPTQALD